MNDFGFWPNTPGFFSKILVCSAKPNANLLKFFADEKKLDVASSFSSVT